jgi:chromosome segregation ATPase
LKAGNEKLRVDYAILLESSTVVTSKLRQEVQELRSQLEVKKTSWDELREELDEQEETCAELQAENSDLKKTCSGLWVELKQKSATAGKDLPEAADLLNQLKTRRKKSKSDLIDLEVILEILEN